jgi:AAA+ ATPase superfamily predicted ATPase
MRNENPFITTGYRDPSTFCNRENETKTLQELIKNGHHIAIFAIRRIGKTGLIHHIFHQYLPNKNMATLYFDILASSNLNDFINQLATEVYNRFPPNKAIGKKIKEMIQQFRPTISFDPLSGSPQISLSAENKSQKESTLGQILGFLDQQNIPIIIAIDEFQQILNYPEKNVEALLRTYMQRMKNINFIFCGSNQEMMHEIFNSAKKPFFGSCTNMHLGYIDSADYKAFIKKQFTNNKRSIDEESLDFVCNWTGLHTFYTQYFCKMLYSKGFQKITLKECKETALEILKQNEHIYFQYKNLLTQAQWNLLIAIAKEERVSKIQSKKFIQTHQLGTPSLVKRGVESLLHKEMIFYNSSASTPYYEVYDKFLMRWMALNT